MIFASDFNNCALTALNRKPKDLTAKFSPSGRTVGFDTKPKHERLVLKPGEPPETTKYGAYAAFVLITVASGAASRRQDTPPATIQTPVTPGDSGVTL